VLPNWPAGTVTILATAGETPHAIPVSAAVRAGPRHALLALAGARRSLERLRADPRVALTIVAHDVAVTAHGRARVLAKPLVDGVVAVEVEVDDVQDHDRPTFAIESGVRWRWTEPEAERRDAEVHAALARLLISRAAAAPPPPGRGQPEPRA
jgi:Pyridoxamine 5'-phosphate oxidase